VGLTSGLLDVLCNTAMVWLVSFEYTSAQGLPKGCKCTEAYCQDTLVTLYTNVDTCHRECTCNCFVSPTQTNLLYSLATVTWKPSKGTGKACILIGK